MRTFPTIETFKDTETLEKLRRILNVFCICNPKRIGYVQGMNFVCATFLYGMELQEEASFWGLIRLFDRMNLSQLYDFDSCKFRQLSY
mmetsp:Transcript_21290/g.28522  ORF Transcript_21290/g.28522 Transcript_21290/m.28522 type:complete len:88 (-) Transcript_21290:863-1126(-)